MQIVFAPDFTPDACPPQWGQLLAWRPHRFGVIFDVKGGFHMQNDPKDFFKGPFDIVPADKSGCGIPLLSVVVVLISAASMIRLS